MFLVHHAQGVDHQIGLRCEALRVNLANISYAAPTTRNMLACRPQGAATSTATGRAPARGPSTPQIVPAWRYRRQLDAFKPGGAARRLRFWRSGGIVATMKGVWRGKSFKANPPNKGLPLRHLIVRSEACSNTHDAGSRTQRMTVYILIDVGYRPRVELWCVLSFDTSILALGITSSLPDAPSNLVVS